jgi:hypothetical protein
MEPSPTVHLINTTTLGVQAALKSTLALARRPDTRVIINVSRGSGCKEEERFSMRFARGARGTHKYVGRVCFEYVGRAFSSTQAGS